MITESLASFFTDFAATSATLGGTAVSGIFDNGYAEAFGMDGSAPSLTLKSSAAAAAAHGTAVVVDGVNYTVQGIEPDGTGVTKLILEKV